MASWRFLPNPAWSRKNCSGPLVLAVAARGAEGQARLAVAQGQRRGERRPRPPPGRSELASPSSSQNIWARVPRQKPSSGMVGELCSQPPLGVAATMLPYRSTTSRWQVSPKAARREPAGPASRPVGAARSRPTAGAGRAPVRASRAAAQAAPRR